MITFAKPQTALFLDLETTGLFPKEAGARILEIGILAVEVPTFREVDSWSTTVAHPLAPQDRPGRDALDGCDDYVRNMHTKNGLAADLAKPAGSPGGPVPLGTALEGALAFYNRHASGKRVYLGGAKPDFDRGWLDVHMSPLAKKFHYRGFDTNAFFILREYMIGVEKSGQTHRVLDDCRQAVKVVHDHFDLMAEVFGGKK